MFLEKSSKASHAFLMGHSYFQGNKSNFMGALTIQCSQEICIYTLFLHIKHKMQIFCDHRTVPASMQKNQKYNVFCAVSGQSTKTAKVG